MRGTRGSRPPLWFFFESRMKTLRPWGCVTSTCLGALFRPRWLRQPAGRGDVLNLSFPVWSRDVDTVVRHQWYITARCTRTLARLRHATLFNPHMHGAAINTHSYCVVRTARLGSNYALAAQGGSAALLNTNAGAYCGCVKRACPLFALALTKQRQ